MFYLKGFYVLTAVCDLCSICSPSNKTGQWRSQKDVKDWKKKGKHFRGVKTYYKTFEKFLKTALLKMVETVSESALSLCKSVPLKKIG